MHLFQRNKIFTNDKNVQGERKQNSFKHIKHALEDKQYYS